MNLKWKVFLLGLFVSSFSFGQLKVEDLKVDTTITGFHYSANFQGTHVYTANGNSDLNAINPSAFSFTIMPNATYEDALLQITYLLRMSIENGYKHSDIIKKDTVINGYRSYYTTITETQKGTHYKNLIFHAFFIKDNTAILFVSGDLDKGKYIENFKKTFYAIKL